MWIKKLKLNYFRNYEETSFNFENKKNLIIGKNGSGKTSILEAIYLLSISKSFRTNNDNNLINNNYHSLFVQGQLQTTIDEDLQIIFSIDKKKTIKINDTIIKKVSDLIGVVNTILFLENDIDLIQRSPDLRRKFLNIIFAQVDKDYLLNLIKYNNILQQRNSYLKNEQKDNIYLNTLDEKLIQYGSELIHKRNQYLIEYNQYFQKIVEYFKIELLKRIQIKYDTNFITIDEQTSKEQIQKEFYNKLIESKAQEERFKFTVIGPHRDDIIFLKDEKYKLAEYSSSGEKRLLVVFLKIAEAKFIKEYKNDLPILLMDDIILELDKKNISIINNYLNTIASQILMTTTEEREQEYNNLKDLNIIRI